jgi:CubicO group peptidase (beta-lactamase class C family)
LTSTALDYAKLCQMLLNGGTFNNTRLLSRKTVELMTTNQIGELNIRDNTNKFGLGFEIYTQKEKPLYQVRKEPSNGAVCITHYTIDPKEDLLLVVMFQVWPKKDGGIEKQVQQMIYQSIID